MEDNPKRIGGWWWGEGSLVTGSGKVRCTQHYSEIVEAASVRIIKPHTPIPLNVI